MADLTMDAAFSGKTLDDATRDEEQFRHLGFWSDGRKVIQPIVGIDLDSIPRVIPATACVSFPGSLSAKPKVAMDDGYAASDRAVCFDRSPPDPHQSSLSRTG